MRMEWRGAEEPREARLKVPTTATRHGVDRRWRPLCLCTASGGPHSGRTRSSPAGQTADRQIELVTNFGQMISCQAGIHYHNQRSPNRRSRRRPRTAAPRWSRSRQRAVSAARRCRLAAVFSTMAHAGRRWCRTSGNDLSLPLKSYAQLLFIGRTDNPTCARRVLINHDC